MYTYKFLKFFSVIGLFFFCSAESLVAESMVPSVYEFLKKIPISVSDAGQSALGDNSANDVPVLVRISESIPGFSYDDLATGGSDLAFGVENGGELTIYPHEIETWDPEGESLIWVKVPTLSAETKFTMYYGNGVSVAESKTAVWSGYKAVWHMNEADGNALDATGSGLDAVPTKHKEFSGDVGAINVGASGKIGGARQNGSKNGAKGAWYAVPEYHLTAASKFSISGWVKMTAVDANCYPRIFSSKRKYNDAYGFEIELAKGSTTSLSARGASSNAAPATVPNLLDWVHLCFVYEDKTVDVYANGVLLKENGAVAAPNETYTLSIGANNDGSEYSFYGLFDEVRLFDGVQDATRVALEYAVMRGECIRIGEAEPIDPTMPDVSSVEVVAGADGFTVSYSLESGDGIFAAVMKDATTGEVISAPIAADSTEVVVPLSSLGAGRVYDCSVSVTSSAGTTILLSAGRVFNGSVSVVKTTDANESPPTPGVFTVTASSPVPVDFAVPYTVGGTAVA